MVVLQILRVALIQPWYALTQIPNPRSALRARLQSLQAQRPVRARIWHAGTILFHQELKDGGSGLLCALWHLFMIVHLFTIVPSMD